MYFLNMENLPYIIGAAAGLVTLLSTTLTFLGKFIKAAKERDKTKRRLLWKEFSEEAIEFVEQLKAKTNGELTGATKKEIALNRVENACVKAKICFDREEINSIIEANIALTKHVNARDKDKILNILNESKKESFDFNSFINNLPAGNNNA